MGHIKTELHCCRDLIDILPARPGGADKVLINLLLVDRNCPSNSNHARILRRTRVHWQAPVLPLDILPGDSMPSTDFLFALNHIHANMCKHVASQVAVGLRGYRAHFHPLFPAPS